MRMNVRFVITGACYVSYSGRQIQLEVPVTQPDGSRTTVADVEAQVRNEWPKDFSEMAESIKTAKMKILKTGRLLSNTDIFEEQLTKAELAGCEVVEDAEKTAEEIEKTSVLMHLVFQKEQPVVVDSVKEGPEVPTPAGGRASSDSAAANGDTSTNHGGREVKSDNCCCAM